MWCLGSELLLGGLRSLIVVASDDISAALQPIQEFYLPVLKHDEETVKIVNNILLSSRSALNLLLIDIFVNQNCE